MAKHTDVLGTPDMFALVANSVDSADSGTGRQVDPEEGKEDSEDGSIEGSEDSEDSEDSDGEYNTNYSCDCKPYKVRGRALTCELITGFWSYLERWDCLLWMALRQ